MDIFLFQFLMNVRPCPFRSKFLNNRRQFFCKNYELYQNKKKLYIRMGKFFYNFHEIFKSISWWGFLILDNLWKFSIFLFLFYKDILTVEVMRMERFDWTITRSFQINSVFVFGANAFLIVPIDKVLINISVKIIKILSLKCIAPCIVLSWPKYLDFLVR